jgi:hypothetical protein
MRPFALLLALSLVTGTAPAVLADSDQDRDTRSKIEAELSGYNEVHFVTTQICIPGGTAPPCAPPTTVAALNTSALRGAVSTGATGKFRARIDESNSMIHYELSYQGLEAAVTQAHIHFGQRHTVGGIVVWLCQTPAGSAGNTPAPAAVAAATPVCPQEGTVEGTITPAQVLTATGQGLNAGEFAELVAAIRAGATYANVHSTLFPPGEIRGHIHSGQGQRD